MRFKIDFEIVPTEGNLPDPLELAAQTLEKTMTRLRAGKAEGSVLDDNGNTVGHYGWH